MREKVIIACYEAGEFNGLRGFILELKQPLTIIFLGEGAYRVGHQWLQQQKPDAQIIVASPLGDNLQKLQSQLPNSLLEIKNLFDEQTQLIIGMSALQQNTLAQYAVSCQAHVIGYHDVVYPMPALDRMMTSIAQAVDELWVAHASNLSLFKSLMPSKSVNVVGHCELSLSDAERWYDRGEALREILYKLLKTDNLHSWIGAYSVAYQRAFSLFFNDEIKSEKDDFYLIMLHPSEPKNLGGRYFEERLLSENRIPYQRVASIDDLDKIQTGTRVLIFEPSSSPWSSADLVAASTSIHCWQSTLAMRANLYGAKVNYYGYDAQIDNRLLAKLGPKLVKKLTAKNGPKFLERNFVSYGMPMLPGQIMTRLFSEALQTVVA